MAHIHEKIDFTVAIFIVHGGRILVIHHRKLDKWLPLGGHIELDEDPEQAALREAREESGLEVELIGERPPTTSPGTRALIAPRFLDIHRINDTHEHIGLIYWARPKNGKLTLASEEHYDIRWCAPADLEMLSPPMSDAAPLFGTEAAPIPTGPAPRAPPRAPFTATGRPEYHPWKIASPKARPVHGKRRPEPSSAHDPPFPPPPAPRAARPRARGLARRVRRRQVGRSPQRVL